MHKVAPLKLANKRKRAHQFGFLVPKAKENVFIKTSAVAPFVMTDDPLQLNDPWSIPSMDDSVENVLKYHGAKSSDVVFERRLFHTIVTGCPILPSCSRSGL